MTDQEFSAMLDEDKVLLVDLGNTLRQQPGLELPADFAQQTAQAAEKRFAQLPALTKLAVRLEPVLSAPIASRVAFPWSLALVAGTAASAFAPAPVTANCGVALLAVVTLWSLLSYFCLTRLSTNAGPGRLLQSLFYLVPLLAAVATAVFCGGFVSALTMFSINFRSSDWSTVLLGPLVGLAVFAYLLSALTPSWRALKAHCPGRPYWALSVQLLHALWLGVIAQLFAQLHSAASKPALVWAGVLLPALLIGVWFGYRKAGEEADVPIGPPLQKTLRSLLLGGLPIAAILAGAYQANLTRDLDQRTVYEQLLVETENWQLQQKVLPPEQNGWTLLRPIFLNRQSPTPAQVARLRGGNLLHDAYIDQHYNHTRDEVEQARADFEQELPLVRAALARPHFAFFATENFSSVSPNFLLCRSVSSGLSALAVDALRNQQNDQALDKLILGLRWAGSFREGSLINLMISLSQQNIALESVERWVFEGKPETAQLRQLLEALRASEPPAQALEASMKHEIYLCDRAFAALLHPSDPSSKQIAEVTSTHEGIWPVLARIMPASYWRSENYAYLNLELAGLSGWRQLGRPGDTNVSEMLPFSFAARQLAPNTRRAQASFMALVTRFQALETVVALEIYQREHGSYPDHLQMLVPAYLPGLPVDFINPKVIGRKPTFHYQRTAQKYVLNSNSYLYDSLQMKTRQSYGPDGVYKLALNF